MSCSFEEPPTTSVSINSQRGNGSAGHANPNNNTDPVGGEGNVGGQVATAAAINSTAAMNNNGTSSYKRHQPTNQAQHLQSSSSNGSSESSSSSNGDRTDGGGDNEGGQNIANGTSDPYQLALVGMAKTRIARNPIMVAPNSPLLINYDQVGFAIRAFPAKNVYCA